MAQLGDDATLQLVRAGVTRRELDVLRCLVERLSNREVAERLSVSVRTVESHVSALLAKLGAGSRGELAALGAALLGDRAARPATNLPSRLTSFVGRARELEEVAGLLGSGRLLTLTGPAGTGKTRLALEVARTTADRYADGVWLAELAPLPEGSAVADRLLAALGGQQVPGRSPVETLVAFVVGRRALLVVDNCEHLLAEAATVVRALLDAAAPVKVLATSREPLGSPGEVVYRVDPLPVPGQGASDLDGVVQSDAVRLLADRARAASPRFRVTAANAAAVAQLCRRLDGLPLALELTAPRLRTFTPDQLTGLLDDRFQLLASGGPALPARHRTLRGAIEWSYDLLGEPERRLFTRLAVFAGSFSLAAAEAVCTDQALARSDVLELLPRLVDRSLVVVDPVGASNRYRLLESLRSFARERLGEATGRSLWRRHAGWFVRVAEEAEPHLRGPDAAGWIATLRQDHDNLVQALEWSLDNEPAVALRLVGALWQFWEDADLRRSAILWAEGALAAGTGPPPARVTALLAASQALRPWEAKRAAPLAEEALTLAERLGDQQLLARARREVAAVRAYNGDVDGAVQPFEAALAHFRSVGDRWQTATTLQTLGLVKDPAEGLTLLGEAHRLFTLERDLLRVANCAYLMAARLVRELGDAGRAEPLAAEALRLSVRQGSEHEQAHARSALAEVWLARGEDARAAELGRDCLAAFRRVGDHRCEGLMLLLLGRAAERAGAAVDALAYLREALGVAALAAHAHTVPVVLDRLAGLLADRDPPVAVLLHAAADARQLGSQPAHLQDPGRGERLEALRRAADPDAFEVAWRRGLQASLDELLGTLDGALDRTGSPAASG
ncbi:MAG TPA: LuxR C-terminal-related transcriptional regulator [Actinomycetes bacterium]